MKSCTHCQESLADDALFCLHCGQSQVADGEDRLIGTVVAQRYLIKEKIGGGGAGTVYLARHVTLQQKMAVKVLHHHLCQDDTAVERFRREATTMAQLDNDHIVGVRDFGRTDDGRLYLAMELLDGQTLAQLLEQTHPLPLPRALDIFGQIAEALIDAHEKGYVHRDLRPANVFLTTRRGREDFVKVMDFGLSKLVLSELEPGQQTVGMSFGDPKYLSPEQAAGEAVDKRSDVYSLGVVLFHMLCGKPPFAGSDVFTVINKHLRERPPRPSQVNPALQTAFDDVLLQALSKDREERFSGVAPLRDAVVKIATKSTMPGLGSSAEPRRRDETQPAIPSRMPSDSVDVVSPDVTLAGPAFHLPGQGGAGVSAVTSADTDAAAGELPAVEVGPVIPAPKPASPPPKSVTPAPKPVAPAPKPVVPAPKPVVPAPKPVVPAPKPVAPESATAVQASESAEKSPAADRELAPPPPKYKAAPVPIAAVRPPERPDGSGPHDIPPGLRDSGSAKGDPDAAPPAPGDAPRSEPALSSTPSSPDEEVPDPTMSQMWYADGEAEAAQQMVEYEEYLAKQRSKSSAPSTDLTDPVIPGVRTDETLFMRVRRARHVMLITLGVVAVVVAATLVLLSRRRARDGESERTPTAMAASTQNDGGEASGMGAMSGMATQESDAGSEPAPDGAAPVNVLSMAVQIDVVDPMSGMGSRRRRRPEPGTTMRPISKPDAGAPAGADYATATRAGRQALARGDTATARMEFLRALSARRGYAPALAGLGEALFEEGRYAQAINKLRAALRSMPASVRTWVLLGNASFRAGRYQAARTAYKTALRLRPGHAEAKKNLSLVERKLGK
ncbi:MAG: serine/threonine-protein kinase [bacterium]